MRAAVGLLVSFLLVPAWVLASDSGTQPQNDDQAGTVAYITLPGDTLIKITQRFLLPGMDWRDLGAVNGILKPRDMPAGTTLMVPVQWLRDPAAQARIEQLAGAVDINGAAGTQDHRIVESDTITTGDRGVVVVVLPDGTEMRIAPGSQVRVERLRNYFGGQAIDARLLLENGEVQSNTPEGRSASPTNIRRDIRIRTPRATAAVRGTQFRVATSESTSSSVLAGDVSWRGQTSQVALQGGFGSSVDDTGQVTEPEVLLPAPMVQVPGKPMSQVRARVGFTPVAGAAAYRVTVADDSELTENAIQAVVEQPGFVLNSERDGDHFVAVRAISTNGVEGYDALAMLAIDARPLAPALQQPLNQTDRTGPSTRLQWQKSPTATGYRVQVAGDDTFARLLLDTRVSDTETLFNDPEAPVAGAADTDPPHDKPTVQTPRAGEPRTRYWRIATIAADETGPFSAAWRFSLTPPPEKIRDDTINP